MYLAKIYVTLKPTVNDPQGLTIKGALHTLGFISTTDVRAGKFIELKLSEPNLEVAEAKVREMCRQLLANPVIENYRFEVQEAGEIASLK
ncbi:MAG: phosphoribosylformylglycinamidine synthase subunit PurS [Dehalococcoidia bacterium]|nr:phosphoribosylformylglycinamidine synthase subunit PurS [Dehalococcoidia bacterium]